MSERSASFLICDDLLVALNGKFTVAGMYTGDIGIPTEPINLAQLVVLFQFETDITEPFKKLVLQVSFPGEAPRILETGMPPLPPLESGRTRVNYKVPFLIAQPVLRAGPIEAKIIHETGELSAGMQWISLQPATPPSITPV